MPSYHCFMGFYRGPGVILRSVLENLALSIVIKTDQNIFSKDVEGKLKPNDTIKPAKKIFSEIGEYYGLLTNHFVHEKCETLARNIRPYGQDVDFSLLPEVSKTELPIPAPAINSVPITVFRFISGVFYGSCS